MLPEVDERVNGLGGLNDDDLDDEPPVPSTGFRVGRTSVVPTNVKRQTNPLVSIIEDPFPEQPKPTKPSQKGTQRKATKKSNLPPEDSKPEVPAPEPKRVVGRLIANKVHSSDLPDFIQANSQWRTTFLPTLRKAFYFSTDPFEAFQSKSLEFRNLVQEIVNLVYPSSGYQIVSEDDPIVLMAYNRINGCRGEIAQEALSRIEEHLTATNAFKTTQDAADWINWGCRLRTGPLFWETPTPIACKARPGAPSFVPPSGRLRSPFLLSVVQNCLRHCEGALTTSECANSVVPKGLFALAMAALERAIYGINTNGTKKPEIKSFSSKNFGAKVNAYLAAFKTITDEQWEQILEACGLINDNDEEFFDWDNSILDEDRVNMFTFNSPVKGN